jgi:hypothetical protein
VPARTIASGGGSPEDARRLSRRRRSRSLRAFRAFAVRWCGYVRAEVDGRFNRYTLIDDRIREIVRLGESVVIDNADRLTSCLVLATEEPS